MSTRHLLCLNLVALFLVTSCLLPITPGGDGDADGDADQQTLDIQQYEQLQADLDTNRVEFQSDLAGDLQVAGNRVFWLHGRDMSRPIKSYDFSTGQEIRYGFSVGDYDNFRVSDEAVAVAEMAGDQVIYHVYDADEAQTELTTVTMEAPRDEQRWWAYSVDGSDLYIVEPKDGVTSLYRASLGGQPVLITTLEEASGYDMGEFWEFGVEDGMMIYVESGRIWQLDLLTNSAEWLENETEVGGWVHFTWDGVLFETAVDGPWFLSYSTRQITDISVAIDASPYQINGTYQSSHLYQQDPTRWRDYIIYVGNSGLFAFNMTTQAVTPILIEPRCDPDNGIPRIDYMRPRVLDNGMLLVTGLESFSCSTGAEGPIFQVDLTAVLD